MLPSAEIWRFMATDFTPEHGFRYRTEREYICVWASRRDYLQERTRYLLSRKLGQTIELALIFFFEESHSHRVTSQPIFHVQQLTVFKVQNGNILSFMTLYVMVYYRRLSVFRWRLPKLQSFNGEVKNTTGCIMSCRPGWDSNPWS